LVYVVACSGRKFVEVVGFGSLVFAAVGVAADVNIRPVVMRIAAGGPPDDEPKVMQAVQSGPVVVVK
jgi:hypothetical protein